MEVTSELPLEFVEFIRKANRIPIKGNPKWIRRLVEWRRTGALQIQNWVLRICRL